MRSRNLLLVMLSLSAASTSARAQEAILLPGDESDALPSRYSVEFILFRYGTEVSAGTEVFVPDEPEPAANDGVEPSPLDAANDVATGFQLPGTLPDTDTAESADGVPAFGDIEGFGAEELIDPDADVVEVLTRTSSVELTVLPEASLTMSAIFERLSRLDAYEPILWSGWTQIVREQADSPAIALRRLGNVPLAIDGTLTLYLGRFVHLVVDLTMDADAEASSTPAPRYGDRPDDRYDDYGYFDDYRRAEPVVVYRIVEDRIMRNGELRYFDHPKFALIAKLTLVEEEESPEPPPAVPASTPSPVSDPAAAASAPQ